MKRYALLASCVWFCLHSPVRAGEHSTFYRHNVGAGAGFLTGYGLQYRHWFPNRHGFQINLGPYLNKTDEQEKVTVSAGLNGLYIARESKFVNLFIYYGTHFWYSHETGTDDSEVPDTVALAREDNGDEYYVYAGAGPGFDIHFWRLSVNLQPGVAFRINNDGDYGLQMSGEISLYYGF
ncbi:MAG: hypothetical protein GF350_10855 [Chitinivibrionales bacterium]|nr:hypothetical protein [Chitinivibrionales bacterium]